MEFENNTIECKFICVEKRSYAVVPKFAVIVNGISFDYYQSAMFLTEHYDKLQKKCYFSSTGREWILADLLKEEAPMMVEDNEVLVQLKANRYRVKDESLNKLLTHFNKLSISLTEEEQLFAFRSVIEEALYPMQMNEEEFVEELGYSGDYLGVTKGIRIYGELRESALKLKLGQNEIYSLLDKLSEQGIE